MEEGSSMLCRVYLLVMQQKEQLSDGKAVAGLSHQLGTDVLALQGVRVTLHRNAITLLVC